MEEWAGEKTGTEESAPFRTLQRSQTDKTLTLLDAPVVAAVCDCRCFPGTLRLASALAERRYSRPPQNVSPLDHHLDRPPAPTATANCRRPARPTRNPTIREAAKKGRSCGGERQTQFVFAAPSGQPNIRPWAQAVPAGSFRKCLHLSACQARDPSVALPHDQDLPVDLWSTSFGQ